MSIKISTYVSISDKPRFKPNASYTSKKNDFIPDSLEIKYQDLFEIVGEDGVIVDYELDYIIVVSGDAKTDGSISDSVSELSNFLRSYDFKKYPLQLETSMFEMGGSYNMLLKTFVPDRNEKKSKSILNASQILEKLKKKN